MSSWAQQREAIPRAAQGGVRARTNAQGLQRLPLANNRLREVLLSRPNGELTRAGQFYYGLVGGPLDSEAGAAVALGGCSFCGGLGTAARLGGCRELLRAEGS